MKVYRVTKDGQDVVVTVGASPIHPIQESSLGSRVEPPVASPSLSISASIDSWLTSDPFSVISPAINKVTSDSAYSSSSSSNESDDEIELPR